MSITLGLRAAALGLVYGLLIRWLRLVKYEKARRRRPTTWGDWGGALLAGLAVAGLGAAQPLLGTIGAALVALLFFLLWLDAVLYRVFTFELGAGGVGGVVLSNLYREVVQLGTAQAFFRAERRFTLLPVVALLAAAALLLPAAPLPRLLLGLLLALYLRPALRAMTTPPAAESVESSDSGASAPRALVHDFLRPRRPRIPAAFTPRPEHAALFSQTPSLPPPSPAHARLRGASVILLTFESLGTAQLAGELRPDADPSTDSRSRARTPFLDSLRPAALTSAHHFCPAPLTNAAHIALYASRPIGAAPGPWTLAALCQAGYKTAYLTAAIAGHYGLAEILNRAGFQHIIDGPALRREQLKHAPRHGPILDQELLPSGIQQLRACLQPGSGPLFVHIHAANTHIPYRVADPQGFGRHDARSDRGRFLNGIEETDALFAALWAALRQLLKERGETQEPLLLISSDHGQSFGESDYFSHGSAVSAEQLGVPLLLHHPALAAGSVPFSTHYDVLPTVLDLLGVVPQWPGLGASLLHPGSRAAHLLWDGQPSRRTSNCLGLLLDERKYALDLLRDTCIESDWDDRRPTLLTAAERRYFEALLGRLAKHQGIQ